MPKTNSKKWSIPQTKLKEMGYAPNKTQRKRVCPKQNSKKVGTRQMELKEIGYAPNRNQRKGFILDKPKKKEYA